MSLRRFFRTDAPGAVLFVRLAVAFTFLAAGSNKLRDLPSTGGFFEGIGFPAPQTLGTLVGVFEVTCGTLVLLGLLTRVAALPLIVIMLTAIASTKLPILAGGPVGPFAAPRGPNTGVMAFLTATRLDFSMLMATLFLLVVGAGRLSLDGRIAGTQRSRRR